jgi:DNA-binding MurR/RpiR family transcriptional regulator
MKFEDRVQIYEYKLNDTDDQIISYIKDNKEEVLNISIQKLAEKLFTVPNTIVRLSKKLGYGGFSELKAALKMENKDEEEFFSNIYYNVKKTYEIIDMDTIDRVARKIKESRDIYFYGIGDSISFCEMMTKNLRCVGKKTEFFAYPHDMIYSAKNINIKDLVFIISTSGETKQLIEACNIVKEKGVFIVSLTHLCDNSISKLSDIALYCWSPKENLNNYNITDRTSLMIVLRKLSEHYWKFYK